MVENKLPVLLGIPYWNWKPYYYQAPKTPCTKNHVGYQVLKTTNTETKSPKLHAPRTENTKNRKHRTPNSTVELTFMLLSREDKHFVLFIKTKWKYLVTYICKTAHSVNILWNRKNLKSILALHKNNTLISSASNNFKTFMFKIFPVLVFFY